MPPLPDLPHVLAAEDAHEPVAPRARAEQVPEDDDPGEGHLDPDAVRVDQAVDHAVVEVREERLDVSGAIGAEVDEVGVLVDVERDERRRVPDRIAVLGVTDVVEEPALVPVVGRPRPAAAGETGRLQVGPPGGDRAEVARDEVAEDALRVAADAAEVVEVELVVLDPADRERELDLQRAELGVRLVRRAEVDGRRACRGSRSASRRSPGRACSAPRSSAPRCRRARAARASARAPRSLRVL